MCERERGRRGEGEREECVRGRKGGVSERERERKREREGGGGGDVREGVCDIVL